MRQALGQQRRVDAFLDVAHQQEAARTDLAEQDHRDVVDAGAAIRWDGRDLPADRPQHVQVDLVDGEPVAGGQAEPDRRAGSGQLAQPGGVAGARAAHPRFEDAADVVALEEQRESGDVILVRVGQDQGVDPPIPRRDAAVERDQQPVGVRTTVDQQSAAARALDEDRVALSDVEDRDARGGGRAGGNDAAGDRDGDDERRGGGTACPVTRAMSRGGPLSATGRIPARTVRGGPPTRPWAAACGATR